MNCKRLNISIFTILLILFIAMNIYSQEFITINFDTLPNGSPVEDSTLIDDDYSSMGVIFSSSVPNGPTARNDNSWSISKPNILSLGSKGYYGFGILKAKFIDPQSDKLATTDSVHFFIPIVYFPPNATATLKLTTFDSDSIFLTESTKDISLTCPGILCYTSRSMQVSAIGISYVNFEVLDARNLGVAIDNFNFTSPHYTTVRKDINFIPEDFTLSQNYPNPFNPQTTISYQLPKRCNVTLSIYNTSGQLIETLVNENKTSGQYSVTWEAKSISSGIYFYKLVAGEYISTKKMLVMK